MQKVRSHIDTKMRGFSLVELLVAVSVFLVFFIAVTHVTVNSSKYARHAVHTERAVQLAEEAIEASRNIRDADFANLIDGTFGLATSSNQFSLSGLPDTTGIFTRSIVVSPIGPYQKQIDVTVSWADQTSDSNAVTLTSYLTDWRKMTPQAGITVTKTVINHGGSKVAADFAPYTVGGGAVTLGIATTTAPGTYTVAEATDTDYILTFGGDCDSSGSITVASGDAKVCSLVNEQRYVPVVSDPTSSLVTQTTATLGANVTSLGLPASISARGTCWGTLPAPATNCIAEGSTTTGVFTHARTGFACGTLYYYRGYAVNAKGTGYSTDATLTTLACSGSWANPSQQSSLNVSGAQAGIKVQVQGSYAYVVRNDGTPDFLVVNISNPASPTITGSLSLTGIPTNIFVSGNYAYVSNRDDNQELQIIHISNPASPSVAGSFNVNGTANANGVYVVGSTAYVVRTTSASDEFVSINVSNPASPTLVGSLNLNATGYEVYVSGNSAFVASGNDSQELQVVNITTPSSPSIIGSANISGNTDAITIAGFGSHVFVGRAANVSTYNIANPASPSLLSTYNGAGTINDIALNLGASNTYLFMTTGNSNKEFEVINVSNPALPVTVGGLNLTSYNGIAYDPANDRAVLVGPDGPELIITRPN